MCAMSVYAISVHFSNTFIWRIPFYTFFILRFIILCSALVYIILPFFFEKRICLVFSLLQDIIRSVHTVFGNKVWIFKQLRVFNLSIVHSNWIYNDINFEKFHFRNKVLMCFRFFHFFFVRNFYFFSAFISISSSYPLKYLISILCSL